MVDPILQHADKALRGNRLVCIALLLGQVVYAGTIAAVQQAEDWESPLADPEMSDTFATIGVATAVVSIVIAYVLRRIMWRRGADGDATRLLQAFLLGNITFQVVLEGASMLNLTLWLITGRSAPFVPAFVVLLLLGVVELIRSRPPSG